MSGSAVIPLILSIPLPLPLQSWPFFPTFFRLPVSSPHVLFLFCPTLCYWTLISPDFLLLLLVPPSSLSVFTIYRSFSPSFSIFLWFLPPFPFFTPWYLIPTPSNPVLSLLFSFPSSLVIVITFFCSLLCLLCSIPSLVSCSTCLSCLVHIEWAVSGETCRKGNSFNSTGNTSSSPTVTV